MSNKNYEYVNHPSHYGGKDNVYECIKVIDAWNLNFCLGTAVRYICRAGQKPDNPDIQDLEKAIWYLQHEVEMRKNQKLIDLANKDEYVKCVNALSNIDFEAIGKSIEEAGKNAVKKLQETVKENKNE